MKDISIRVDNLGKQYRIGQRERYRALRDILTNAMTSPVRRLRNNSHAKEHVKEEDNFIWALRNVSFEVERGEVVGIIGPNGAGKTTLLKILSRITYPTEGEAEIHGRLGSLLEVGTGFHPELTGQENIYLNGAILGMKKVEIDRKLDEIISFAEIEKFIDTPVKRYSSGMYVRLAFAVAAHLEPEILLVDEVLAVGDASFQKKCLGKMEDVGRQGRTVFFVSHNMSAITRLCSRAFLFESGSVVKDTTAEAAVSEYLAGVFSTGGMKTWKNLKQAPGTEQLKLTSLSVSKENGRPVNIASVEDTLTVKVGYYVGVPNLKFRCSLIFNIQGVNAFFTHEPVEIVREKVGTYHSFVTIPKNLLSEGMYTISVTMAASRGVKFRYVQEFDVAAIQIYDPITGSSARGDYTERVTGVVRPLLPWGMSFQGSQPELNPAEET